MHTALLKDSKGDSSAIFFFGGGGGGGGAAIPLQECKGVERVFTIVNSCVDLTIN